MRRKLQICALHIFALWLPSITMAHTCDAWHLRATRHAISSAVACQWGETNSISKCEIGDTTNILLYTSNEEIQEIQIVSVAALPSRAKREHKARSELDATVKLLAPSSMSWLKETLERATPARSVEAVFGDKNIRIELTTPGDSFKSFYVVSLKSKFCPHWPE